MKFLGTTLCLAAACGFSAPASAVFLNNSTGLASPQQTITFDAPATPLAAQDPVTTQFQSSGVTFTGAFYNPDSSTLPNISGNRIGNFQAGIGHSALFQIDFSSNLSQVAFAEVTQPGVSTFEALLNGVSVQSMTAATSLTSPTNFYGFTGIVFNQVRISVASSDNAFLLDNLQTVAAVPEPASWALLLAGMSVVGLAGRRGRGRTGRSSGQASSC